VVGSSRQPVTRMTISGDEGALFHAFNCSADGICWCGDAWSEVVREWWWCDGIAGTRVLPLRRRASRGRTWRSVAVHMRGGGAAAPAQ
jgi:hypothetical protein